MSRSFDVAIVGGGLVGTTLALALRQWQLSVALIDPSRAGGIDSRRIALSYGSARLFRSLGQWGGIEREAEPIREIHVSRRGGFGFTRIRAEACGVEALGHVVSARLLERRLNETLDAGTGTGTGPGVGVGPAVGLATESAIGAGDGAARFERFLAMVEEVEAGGREAIVSGHGPDGPVRVEARLVVGADGADSAVRRAAGLPLRVHRCDHVAIAGDLSAELAHRGRAFERFTERGPLAVLPLGKDRCGFVWAVPESIASDERFGDCEFGTRLAEAFGSRLGRLGQVDVRVRHPLRVCHAPRITAPRTVLVGNAANALHPVGAQGFNLGLRDVEALARTLGDASARGADPASVLDRYALERRPDHAWGRLLTGALLRVYGSRAPLAPALGAAALFALDRFGPVKRQFASRTMGAGWPLPAGVVRVLDGTGFAGRWGTSRAD